MKTLLALSVSLGLLGLCGCNHCDEDCCERKTAPVLDAKNAPAVAETKCCNGTNCAAKGENKNEKFVWPLTKSLKITP